MENRDKALIELLEKWRNGQFTQSDEQDLKALAREGDAFVKAAIDGILSTHEQAHDMTFQRLQKRLAARTSIETGRKKNWYAAAAAFALLCVAVWWIWPRRQPAAEENNLAAVTPAADSQTAVSAPLPELHAHASKKRSPGTSMASSEREESFPDSAVVYADDDGIHSMDALVVKEEERPVSIPTITAAPDHSRIIRNAAPPDDEKSGDVPVESAATVGYGNAKKAPQKAVDKVETKAAVQKRARVQSTPSPMVGWDRFRADMKALKLPGDAKAQGLTRLTAVLQLDINPDSGTIQKVTVLQKAGFGCDARAEIFVRNYLWVVPSGNSGSVVTEVEFN